MSVIRTCGERPVRRPAGRRAARGRSARCPRGSPRTRRRTRRPAGRTPPVAHARTATATAGPAAATAVRGTASSSLGQTAAGDTPTIRGGLRQGGAHEAASYRTDAPWRTREVPWTSGCASSAPARRASPRRRCCTPAAIDVRLLRGRQRGRRQLALPQRQRDVLGLPVAAHQHLAAADGVPPLPDARGPAGLPEPLADRGVLRRLRRPLRPPRQDHVPHRGRQGRAALDAAGTT